MLRWNRRHDDAAETVMGSDEGGLKHECDARGVAKLAGARSTTHAQAAGSGASTSRLPGRTMNVWLMLFEAMLQMQRTCSITIASEGAARTILTKNEPRGMTPATETLDKEEREEFEDGDSQLENTSH